MYGMPEALMGPATSKWVVRAAFISFATVLSSIPTVGYSVENAGFLVCADGPKRHRTGSLSDGGSPARTTSLSILADSKLNAGVNLTTREAKFEIYCIITIHSDVWKKTYHRGIVGVEWVALSIMAWNSPLLLAADRSVRESSSLKGSDPAFNSTKWRRARHTRIVRSVEASNSSLPVLLVNWKTDNVPETQNKSK